VREGLVNCDDAVPIAQKVGRQAATTLEYRNQQIFGLKVFTDARKVQKYINKVKENYMFLYLYKIENLIDGKYYIGVHKTYNLEDGYFGSGKRLHLAIEKHGKENFRKTILEFFDTEEAMFSAEASIVNEEFVKDKLTYNMKVGGNGGWNYVHERGLNRGFTGKTHSEETKKLLSELASGREVSDATRKKLSDNSFSKRDPDRQRKHASEAAKKRNKKCRTEEELKQVSEKIKQLHQSGHYDCSHLREFSNKGRRWINDGKLSKMIPSNVEIPKGWSLGRLKAPLDQLE
jgi:hypothetical protein